MKISVIKPLCGVMKKECCCVVGWMEVLSRFLIVAIGDSSVPASLYLFITASRVMLGDLTVIVGPYCGPGASGAVIFE